MQFEAATHTLEELQTALSRCLRRPHGNVNHGKLYISPDSFTTPGKETNLCISRFSIIDCTGNIHIGPWCMIGARSRIYTHDHIHDGLNPLLDQQERYGVVWQDKYIGRDVWIHENVIVLYQVTEIPDGAVIGAGAVLTKNPGPYENWPTAATFHHRSYRKLPVANLSPSKNTSRIHGRRQTLQYTDVLP